MLAPWKNSYDQPRQHIKKQRHYFAHKGLSSQSYGFSSSHVWMWESDHKESWALKNWCFWTVVLEKTLESPSDCTEIKSALNIHWKDWCWSPNTLPTWCEVVTPRKDPDAGKDWRQGKKGTTGGWDGWMASPTRWTWVWTSSRSWWWTEKHCVLLSMGFQRIRQDWVTELSSVKSSKILLCVSLERKQGPAPKLHYFF